jgi:Protein of unknown function (DUF3300)
MAILKQIQAVFLSLAITIMVVPAYAQTATAHSSTPSAQELQQLVAPIALYPDNLIAQILAASTYPTQIVEAERWMQEHKNLQGKELAQVVNEQIWDPSIKALTEFPQVLDNMNKNLSWTSALGEAYTNNSKAVMSAIQVLRADAQHAGNLKSTSEQTVSTQGQTIVIEPANPEVVYVPSYAPEVYGVPVAAYPGYSGWGTVAAGAISFGAGMAVGAAFGGGYGWGWHGWGANWGGGNVTYNRNTFVSNSNTFANRNMANVNRNMANVNRDFNSANVNRGNINSANVNRGNVNRNAADMNRANAGSLNKPSSGQFDRSDMANRGFGSADRSSMGRSSGSFGGFSQGGAARADSFRGASSFGGGGGGFRGGGGGFRGGGGGRR